MVRRSGRHRPDELGTNAGGNRVSHRCIRHFPATDNTDTRIDDGVQILLGRNLSFYQIGTTDEVRAETREHIERLSTDGGYVVCSSHSIIDSVIPENYLAMVDETHRVGVYE